MSTESPATRKYAVFISYRHADNKEMGRKWANWLHEALESYEVPEDLIGITNQRGERVPASLYPVFRDEEELAADADLSTSIKRALENSGQLVVVCSPRAVQSRFVADEIRYFKELGHSHRILALIIDGEPNASGCPIKCECFGADAECFPLPLRFGVIIGEDPRNIDWTVCAEPIAADVRPSGRPEQGWTTTAAYQEELEQAKVLNQQQIQDAARDYAGQLERAKLKIIAGALGLPLGVLTQRDKARQLAQAKARIEEMQRHLEALWLEQGRTWMERADAALNKRDHLSAMMLAGRSIGYHGYGRKPTEAKEFDEAFPMLMVPTNLDPVADKERVAEVQGANKFINSIQPIQLPLWASNISSEVHSIAFSPDGFKLASGSGDCSITLWDSTTGKRLDTLKGHSKVVYCVRFSPDGSRIASGSADKTIKIWDASTGKEVACFRGHTDAVMDICFSPDGKRLASGSGDRTIKIWDTTLEDEHSTLFGHQDAVRSVAISPNGSHLVSGSEDGEIRVWRVDGGAEQFSLEGHSGFVGSLAFTIDGTRFVSASEDSTIKLWSLETGQKLVTFHGHTSSVIAITVGPDGFRIASGSADNTLKEWDISTGRELLSTLGHTTGITGVAFSSDGGRLFSSSNDGTVKQWDSAISRILESCDGHIEKAYGMALSRDQLLLASGSHDTTVKIWDVRTWRELTTLRGHSKSITSVTFSPDDTQVATSSLDFTIKLWEANTGRELYTFCGHSHVVGNIAFSPIGTRLASCSWDNTISLWDTASGEKIQTLIGHADSVLIAAFSPNGSLLASGSSDKSVRLWDATTGREIARFLGHTNPIVDVAFTNDGSRLATSTRDGQIKLWEVVFCVECLSPTPDDLAEARQRLDTTSKRRVSIDHHCIAYIENQQIHVAPSPTILDLTAPMRAGLVAFQGRQLVCPDGIDTTPMIHYRQDTLAKLADPKLTPERRAELRMELCTKSSQFRAATALWQRLLQGEWPGFEGVTVPKDQAPATIPVDSPIRRLYLLALIDATKHPQIHGHPTICQTAAQIAPVLTKEMMATPTISLAMMSLMQTLAKDDSPDMSAPRAALLKRLDEVATKDWLAVLRESTK